MSAMMSDCAGPSLFRCVQRTGVQASNRFYERGALPAVFDQQPVEACATASACLDAYRVYDDSRWLTCGRWAFNWSLGENHLRQWLFDPSTGDCRDGLHIDRVIRTREPGRVSRGAVRHRRPALSISITALPTRVWRWRPGVSVNCSTGWIDTAPRVTMRSGAIRSVPPSSFVVVYAQLF